MKKKWIFGGILVIIFVFGFAFLGKSISSEKEYCYYKQELIYNEEEHTLEGKQTVGFYNYTDAVLSEVRLHLYPNAFRQNAKASVVSLANVNKAYPNGKSYGCILIETVSQNEKYLEYEITGEDQNILCVTLPNELYPNETVEFEIGFWVELANVNHRLGYGVNTINLCNYYPVLCVYENGGWVQDLYNSNGDPFYSKISNFEVCLTYNKNYVLASTGEQKNVIDGDKKITHITAKCVRDFAMVLSNKFTVYEDEINGTEVFYYTYEDAKAKETVNLIKEVLNFNKKFGEYPYKTISVVEANFIHGGMEYPSLVLISDDLADYETYQNVVIHELCHQWWYGVVGNNQYSYGFLDEGLTDYTTALFYDEFSKYGLNKDKIFANATNGYVNFCKVYKDVKENFSTSMIRKLNEFETENEYVYLTYTKGMLLFADLEDLLGEKRMEKCLKAYYKEFKFKEATPQDLINCFSRASGRNLQSHINSWLGGEVVIKSASWCPHFLLNDSKGFAFDSDSQTLADLGSYNW